MRIVGVSRSIDYVGRVQIPKAIRNAMELKEDDPLEVSLEDWDNEKVIIIRRPPLPTDLPEIEKHIKALEDAAKRVHPKAREAYLTTLHKMRRLFNP